MESTKPHQPPENATKATEKRRSNLALPLALAAGLVLGIGGVILWQYVRSLSISTSPPPPQGQVLSSTPRSLTLTSWNVLIKPEYIAPDMPHEKEPGQRKVLVDFQGLSSLPEGTQASLAFHVPSGGTTGMVCAIDSQGRHYMTSPETVLGTPYDTVQFASNKPGFHMAFSYPAPASETEELVFEYPLLPLYPVDDMTVVVQQPPLVQNFSIEQENVASMEYSTEQKEEFTYHQYRLAKVAPGQKMVFRIRYAMPEKGRPGPAQTASAELPAFAYNSANSLKSYRIAQRIPDVLGVMPCYCGCEGAHDNLRDCFIKADKGGYESHASGCDLCSTIAIDVDRLISNHSLKETRELIEKKYGRYGKGTPTPPIEG